MKTTCWTWMGLALLGVIATGCDGEGAVGDECDAPGATADVCEDGSICSQDSLRGGYTCLPLCVDDSQCLATEACNGVEGSNLKACRPKT